MNHLKLPIQGAGFRLGLIGCDQRPNLTSYLAMHQDYSENPVIDEYEKLSLLSEQELGERLVRNCIKKKHWGVLEHPSITLNVINFPHSVMVQARTHRIGVSFDCQSQRYTGRRILRLYDEILSLEDKFNRAVGANYHQDFISPRNQKIEEVFYFRPCGEYKDRESPSYIYTRDQRVEDIDLTAEAIKRYYYSVNEHGHAPEHARDILTQNIRQHFVVTFNARSLLHFLDLRVPLDAQPEIRTFGLMLFGIFKSWMPEVAEYYEKTRLGKNLQAP